MQFFSGITNILGTATKLTLTHSVKKQNKYGCLPVYKYTMLRSDNNKTHTRIAYRSFRFNCITVGFFLALLGGLILIDLAMKDALYDYTLGDGKFSIKSLQKTIPRWGYDLAWVQTNMGGGLELFAYMFYCLFFFPRSRFFYALAVSGIAYALGLQLKLSFADPRPYHVDPKIIPFNCKPTFGNPSGHSLASAVTSFVVYMDVFHGVPITFSFEGDNIYHGGCKQFMAWLLAVYWTLSIPFTRYLGGVHSLDQVIFGSMIGLLIGVFSHFVVRDNIIWFFETVVHWHDTERSILTVVPKHMFGAGDNEQVKFIQGVEQEGLEEVHDHTLKGQAKADDKAGFRPMFFTICSLILWLQVIVLALIAWIADSEKLTEKSAEIQLWKSNLDKVCNGLYNHANAYHNRMFKFAGSITLHIFSMIFFVWRKRIGLLLFYDVKLQDGLNFKNDKRSTVIKQILIRLLVGFMMVGEFFLVAKGGTFFKGDKETNVGMQLVLMCFYIIWPCLVTAYILSAGIYDLKIQLLQKYLHVKDR